MPTRSQPEIEPILEIAPGSDSRLVLEEARHSSSVVCDLTREQVVFAPEEVR